MKMNQDFYNGFTMVGLGLALFGIMQTQPLDWKYYVNLVGMIIFSLFGLYLIITNTKPIGIK